METTPVLNAQLRDKLKKAKQIRKEKLIPAEYYGRGIQNVSLSLPYQEFRKLYRTAGTNTIIDLKIEGQGDKKVLVHDVNYDPIRGDVRHVEFIHVRMDEEVTTHVRIKLEGQAPAVKEQGGILIQSLDEIEITCLPGDLIHEVTLNIDSLTELQVPLHVSDIVLPPKIKLVTDPETPVVSVLPPREEEVETAAPEALPEVEVLTGKKEEASEEGGEKKE